MLSASLNTFKYTSVCHTRTHRHYIQLQPKQTVVAKCNKEFASTSILALSGRTVVADAGNTGSSGGGGRPEEREGKMGRGR